MCIRDSTYIHKYINIHLPIWEDNSLISCLNTVSYTHLYSFMETIISPFPLPRAVTVLLKIGFVIGESLPYVYRAFGPVEVAFVFWLEWTSLRRSELRELPNFSFVFSSLSLLADQVSAQHPHTYTPVSYTHLDVYKRQPQRLRTRGSTQRKDSTWVFLILVNMLL